jgi:hypothetical protein
VGEGENDVDGNWLMVLLVRPSHRQKETIRKHASNRVSAGYPGHDTF